MLRKLTLVKEIIITYILILTIIPQIFAQNRILFSKQFYYYSTPIFVNLSVKDQEEGERLSREIYRILTNYIFNYSYESGSYLSNITYKSYKNFVECNDDLLKMIGIIMNYYYSTKAISPTIGLLIDIWGFNNKPTLPTKEDINYALKISSPKNIVISQGKIKLKNKNIKFYLKPFAIGLSLEKIKELLIKEGIKNAIITVDKRYSLVMGKKFDNEWVIGVRNPLAAGVDEFMLTFNTKDRFISISSVDEDNFNIDFKNYFSIIDPRSGYPPNNKIVSVVVVGKDGVESIVLSRLLIVLGEIGGLRFAQKNNIPALFVISEGGKMNFIKTSKWISEIDKQLTKNK